MRRRKPLGRQDQEILSALVYWHYDQGVDLATIVKNHLPISRSKAHELLRLAKGADLIKTFVDFEPDPTETLAVRIQNRWEAGGLKKVLIMPSPANDRDLDTYSYRAYVRSALGTFAARYLSDLDVPVNEHICLAGGRAMLSIANQLKPKHTQFVVRPCSLRGRFRDIAHLDAAPVVMTLHARFREQGISVVCPETLPGDVSEMWKRPEIRAVFGKEARRPFLLISSLGRRRFVPSDGVGPDDRTSTYVKIVAHDLLYRKHFANWDENRELKPKDLDLIYKPLRNEFYAAADNYLRERGVVGEISGCAMDANGNSVDTLLEQSTLSIKLDRLRSWREDGTETIFVVSGSRLAAAAKAALKGQYVSVLICDTALAAQLLDPSELPEPYREIKPTPED